MNGTTDEQEIAAIRIIADELARAIAAAKCHQCGCLQQTVEALSSTPVGRHSGLASKLAEARATFKPKRYDCLGCSVCYPAIAANAFGEAFPKAVRALTSARSGSRNCARAGRPCRAITACYVIARRWLSAR